MHRAEIMFAIAIAIFIFTMSGCTLSPHAIHTMDRHTGQTTGEYYD